ncbi:transglutaminase-like domain-containing protein [Butyrivibrio sp. AE2032]|uniref:transglutaminase-like domain-containing protein n=1 Tax=Butyrivibrio sp. AE2032 TaxID=1458463 RepID=UPI00163A9160|nr:transglutaminase-like domain-containing protein [Butyrivibrio sp. AE2032]
MQRASQRPVQRTDRSQQRQAPANAKKPVQKTAVPSYNFIKPLLIAVAALLVILAGVRGYLFFKDENGLLKNEVTIEAGSAKPELSMFFEQEPAIPGLVSSNLDFDSVNTALPQTINFNISIYGKNNACKLIIADTVPPAGTGIAQSIFACDALPDAAGCVTGIEDITDVTVSWKDVPDMSAGGSFIVSALLTDGCGNETVVGVPFEVTKDSSAPVIEGAQDLQYYIGDTVSYRNGISVTDDYDTAPSLEINTDNVILTEEGTYEVVYTARDFSGNEASETVSIKVEKKPEGYVEPEVVYAAAKEILDEITEPGMTEEEIALQIVWWCRYNIHFILRTYSNSWTEAAYNAFKTRTGNCFSTAYAVKALLDVAGIENMIIERYPYETATHFWNYVKLDGQWYHCDATWREGYDSYFFMYTTKELLDFWQGGWNGFQFKQDKFPESATKSVQSRIDYKNHTFKDE